MNAGQEAIAVETKCVLDILHALGTEEQRIAFAVLEGMRLQQTLDAQRKADERDSA